MSAPSPPVLLTVAGYYGTLAAARCLGRAGIEVQVADPNRTAIASWSRYTTRRLICPPISQPERFVSWLLEEGRREPGRVLPATSDDVAWLIAKNRGALAESYRLDIPPLATVEALLSKRRLSEAGSRVGLRSPESFFPSSEADLRSIAGAAPLPLIIKPTTQVLSTRNKGQTVVRREDLLPAYRAFRTKNTFPSALKATLPECDWPMLQAFRPEAASSIYSLAGYCRPGTHELLVLASKKVLQRPRQLGIGLCFESAPVRPELREAISALCRDVGYAGVFEAEVIDTGQGPLLIDFNPRFYSQMAFEIDRGLPLPMLAYLSACGAWEALNRVAEDARRAISAAAERVYVHRLVLEVLTRAQAASGSMTRHEVERWRAWLRQHRGHTSDAVLDPDDPLPAGLDWVGTSYSFVRRPRAFLRDFVFGK